VLHRVFEAQAARTPDAVAVKCSNDSLTYRAVYSFVCFV
jgi:non-ribosomal peptide synthetase component F